MEEKEKARPGASIAEVRDTEQLNVRNRRWRHLKGLASRVERKVTQQHSALRENKQANHLGAEQTSYALSLTYSEPISIHNKFEGFEFSEETEHDHRVPETDPDRIRVRTRQRHASTCAVS